MDNEVRRVYKLMLLRQGRVIEMTQLNRTHFLRISTEQGVEKIYLNNGSWYA